MNYSPLLTDQLKQVLLSCLKLQLGSIVAESGLDSEPVDMKIHFRVQCRYVQWTFKALNNSVANDLD